jgi:hypothetical protein
VLEDLRVYRRWVEERDDGKPGIAEGRESFSINDPKMNTPWDADRQVITFRAASIVPITSLRFR